MFFVTCFTTGETTKRTVWTVTPLCAELAMPDGVPWRNAMAEKQHKPVRLSSSIWLQTQKVLGSLALVGSRWRSMLF